MAKSAAGTGLRWLTARAPSDDQAWHELVARLAPDVEYELARHGLVGALAEPARRATWRSLARRLQLGPPDDVASWVRERASFEAHVTSLQLTRVDV